MWIFFFLEFVIGEAERLTTKGSPAAPVLCRDRLADLRRFKQFVLKKQISFK